MSAPDRRPTPSRLAAIRAAVAEQVRRPRFDLAVAALIVASVLALFLEPSFASGSPERRALQRVNDLLAWVFAAELLLRFLLSPLKRRFFLRHAADLLAVLPMVAGLDFLRVLLFLRLFRLGAIGSRLLALRRDGHQRTPITELSVLASVSVLVVLVGAFTVFRFDDAVRLDNESWDGSLWYSVATLVAGEPIGGSPTTQLGRAVSLSLILLGMVFFGAFIATMSTFGVHLLTRRLERNPMEIDELSGHVLVCGWNHSGPTLLRELFAQGAPPGRAVVILSEHRQEPPHLHTKDLPRDLVYHMRGDYTRIEVLEEAGVQRASMAVLLADSTQSRSAHDQDARTVLAALTLERIAPHVFCCAELHDEQHAPLLRRQGVEEVVVSNWLTGVILGSVSRTHGLMPVISDILSAQKENAFHKAPVPPAFVGWTAERIHAYLKQHHEAILVSIERPDDENHHRCGQIVNPSNSERLQQGDVLVVISRGLIRLPERPVGG